MNDLIRRQDAIKYFIELWECIQNINDREEWEDVCITTVNEIKSTEPKRKKGHWIYYDEYAEAVTHTCSECGKRMTTAIGVKASYCWNCGADMTGGKEE